MDADGFFRFLFLILSNSAWRGGERMSHDLVLLKLLLTIKAASRASGSSSCGAVPSFGFLSLDGRTALLVSSSRSIGALELRPGPPSAMLCLTAAAVR